MAPATKRRQNNDDGGSPKKSKTIASTTSRRVTRLMTTDVPRRAVFTTAELLESILLCLPPKTVVGARRTCRQFHDIVASSTKLQEHVFLRRLPYEWPLWHVQPRHNIQPTYRQRSAFIKVAGSGTDLGSGGTPIVTARPVTLHPILGATHTQIGLDGVRQRAEVISSKRFSIGEVASWRDMYLTNPPVTKATIILSWGITGVAWGVAECVVENSNGVVLGEMIDTAFNTPYSEQDSLFVREDNRWYSRSLKNETRSARALAESFEQGHERKIKWRVCAICLQNIIIPTATEWQQIHEEL